MPLFPNSSLFLINNAGNINYMAALIFENASILNKTPIHGQPPSTMINEQKCSLFHYCTKGS